MCINRGSVSARAARTGRGVRGPSDTVDNLGISDTRYTQRE